MTHQDTAYSRWKEALPEELDFWREWLEKKGGEWPEDYVRRFDGNGELQENLKAVLPLAPGGAASILDVGSGPGTRIGRVWEGRTIAVTAVDPLADDYHRLLGEFGIEPHL